MHSIFRKALIAYLACSAAFAIADEIDPEAVERRVAEMAERLELSDEQIELIKPVLQEGMEKQEAVLESYGIDLSDERSGSPGLGFRKARAMRKEMTTLREGTRNSMQKILTQEQMDEFLQMQDERAAETRERLRAGR